MQEPRLAPLLVLVTLHMLAPLLVLVTLHMQEIVLLIMLAIS